MPLTSGQRVLAVLDATPLTRRLRIFREADLRSPLASHLRLLAKFRADALALDWSILGETRLWPRASRDPLVWIEHAPLPRRDTLVWIEHAPLPRRDTLVWIEHAPLPRHRLLLVKQSYALLSSAPDRIVIDHVRRPLARARHVLRQYLALVAHLVRE